MPAEVIAAEVRLAGLGEKQSSIWAAGVTLFSMFSGQYAIRGECSDKKIWRMIFRHVSEKRVADCFTRSKRYNQFHITIRPNNESLLLWARELFFETIRLQTSESSGIV